MKITCAKHLDQTKWQNITGIHKMYLIIVRKEISLGDKNALNIMGNALQNIEIDISMDNIKQHHNIHAAEIMTLKSHFSQLLQRIRIMLSFDCSGNVARKSAKILNLILFVSINSNMYAKYIVSIEKIFIDSFSCVFCHFSITIGTYYVYILL